MSMIHRRKSGVLRLSLYETVLVVGYAMYTMTPCLLLGVRASIEAKGGGRVTFR
jgi:hypothetical protein